MKKIETYGAFVLILMIGAFGYGQSAMEYQKAVIDKADWHRIGTGAGGDTTDIDKSIIYGKDGVVVVNIRWTKRGITIYSEVAGHCLNDTLLQVKIYTKISANAKLKKGKVTGTEDTVEPGSVGYSLLDYACKNAKQFTNLPNSLRP